MFLLYNTRSCPVLCFKMNGYRVADMADVVSMAHMNGYRVADMVDVVSMTLSLAQAIGGATCTVR